MTTQNGFHEEKVLPGFGAETDGEVETRTYEYWNKVFSFGLADDQEYAAAQGKAFKAYVEAAYQMELLSMPLDVPRYIRKGPEFEVVDNPLANNRVIRGTYRVSRYAAEDERKQADLGLVGLMP
ncbi:MAG: hypothetical protein NXI16_01390 [Alphaproteobacteria bacterium]|nr:hypothetical protein [Alphaproteobacteria bacterium]